MNTLTPVDVASIKVFITQLFDDLFRFELQVFDGEERLMILGKSGPIPEDYCVQMITELKEYHYVGEVACIVGFGRAVVVRGVE